MYGTENDFLTFLGQRGTLSSNVEFWWAWHKFCSTELKNSRKGVSLKKSIEKKMEKGDALLDRGYYKTEFNRNGDQFKYIKKSNYHCDHCFKGFRAVQRFRKLLDDDLRKLSFVLGGLLKYLDRASKEIL